PMARPKPRDRTGTELADVDGAGTEASLGSAMRQPAVVIHEAHETEGERRHEDEREPGEVKRRADAGRGLAQRQLHGPNALREHVPEKKEEDPGCACVQVGAHRRRTAAYAAQREIEERGEGGDGAEEEDL